MPTAVGINDPTRVYDGWTSMVGGQDAGRDADELSETQSWKLANIVCRGGKGTTRPAIVERPVNVTTENYYSPDGDHELEGPPEPGSISSETAFKTHIFQGAEYYGSGPLECLIAMVGGRIFKVMPTPAGCDVEEIVVERRNRNTIPIAYLCQAEKYMVIQDGESTPIILDGTTPRRALDDEVPVGKMMAYGMGRLIVILNSGEILFGDIYNGTGNFDADVLKFTETGFLNEGGSSRLPPKMGKPTAIAFYPQQDTALGQGELIVFGESGAESFFLSLPRDQWKESQFQRDALLSVGARGHRSISNANEDLWFRAEDGWRSYRQARAEVNQWTQIPPSTPVRNFVDFETPWLLKYGSSIHFDNRLICTTTPIPNSGRLYHAGMVVLDFDILSTFGRNNEPAWDGHHWSDLKILQLVKGKFGGEERAFAFALNAEGENTVFDITRNGIDDSSGPIPWEIISRRMSGSSQSEAMADKLKRLIGGDVWVSDVIGTAPVTINVHFRSDERQVWTFWNTFTVSQNGTAGSMNNGHFLATPGGRARKRLPTPTDGQSDEDDLAVNLGYDFQVRLTGTGHCRIRKFKAHMQRMLEESKGDC